MRIRGFLAWLMSAACLSAPTLAASPPFLTNPTTGLGVVVTTCGAAQGVVAGTLGPFTVDVNGNLCTSGSGGGGGGSVTQGTTPWVDSITTWAGGVLGAMANYGTSPGAVLVPGVNAFVTNTIAVTGTFWQATQPISAAASALADVLVTNTDIGPPGATACATDTGSCSLNALLQRLAQRLTTINTTLGTPIQATGGTVGLTGNAGAVTQSSVSVTNASTALLTAAQFTNFEKICVALTATTGVWVNWANAAAVTAAPSEYIPPGQCDTWVKSTGFMPTAAAFAISNSASTIAVTVEGN